MFILDTWVDLSRFQKTRISFNEGKVWLNKHLNRWLWVQVWHWLPPPTTNQFMLPFETGYKNFLKTSNYILKRFTFFMIFFLWPSFVGELSISMFQIQHPNALHEFDWLSVFPLYQHNDGYNKTSVHRWHGTVEKTGVFLHGGNTGKLQKPTARENPLVKW